MQDQVLGRLVNKLKVAMSEVQKLEKKPELTGTDQQLTKGTQYKAWKYTLIKKSLDAAIGELQAWQQTFDPTWYLVLTISDRLIDKQLDELSKTTSSNPHVERNIIASAKGIRNSLKPESGVEKKVFLPANDTSESVRIPIPYSTALLYRPANKTPFFILDSVPITPGINPNI